LTWFFVAVIVISTACTAALSLVTSKVSAIEKSKKNLKNALLSEVSDIALQVLQDDYNTAVSKYNTAIGRFPGNLVAFIFNFKAANFIEVTEDEPDEVDEIDRADEIDETELNENKPEDMAEEQIGISNEDEEPQIEKIE